MVVTVFCYILNEMPKILYECIYSIKNIEINELKIQIASLEIELATCKREKKEINTHYERLLLLSQQRLKCVQKQRDFYRNKCIQRKK